MQTEGMDACFLFERPSLQTMPLENRPNNSELYHIVREMKIRESSLQTGNLGYKTGLSFTNGESWVTNGILGLLFTGSKGLGAFLCFNRIEEKEMMCYNLS